MSTATIIEFPIVTEYYVVSMELGTETKAIKTWPEFGGSYVREEALDSARRIQAEIDSGKWDDRKRDDYSLRMCVDVVNDKTLELLSVIKV